MHALPPRQHITPRIATDKYGFTLGFSKEARPLRHLINHVFSSNAAARLRLGLTGHAMGLGSDCSLLVRFGICTLRLHLRRDESFQTCHASSSLYAPYQDWSLCCGLCPWHGVHGAQLLSASLLSGGQGAKRLTERCQHAASGHHVRHHQHWCWIPNHNNRKVSIQESIRHVTRSSANTRHRYRMLIWASFVLATIGCGLLITLSEVRAME